MSYKKDLRKFQENKSMTPNDAIAFAIGKNHLRLPNADEMNQLIAIIDPKDIEDGDDEMFEIAEGNTKAAMENLKYQIASIKLTRRNLQQLWNLARNRRKRAWLIAAIAAGSLIIIGGATLGVMALMNRRNDMKDTSNVNDDVSDIEVYSEDIPQVDIETDSEA